MDRLARLVQHVQEPGSAEEDGAEWPAAQGHATLTAEAAAPPRPETAHHEYRSVDPCPGVPQGFELASHPALDAKQHLQIEPPSHGFDESYRRVPFAEAVQRGSRLVATEPFRVFSDEGIRLARGDFFKNVSHVKAIGRSTTLRHLGFRSSFYRGFAYAPEMLSVLSDAAGESIAPHPHFSNIAHINVGNPNGGAPEMWHQDSVDFVLIVMLGDTTDMEGGDLLVYMDDPCPGSLDKLAAGTVPEEKIMRIPSPPAGYGIFLRGSKLFHTVTSLMSARENRMSIVNSYQRLDVFAADSTRLHSQAVVFGDGHEIANVEFARHRAHRAAGQLAHFLGSVAKWGSDATTLASFLESTGKELESAAAILRGDLCDRKAEAVGASHSDEKAPLQKMMAPPFESEFDKTSGSALQHFLQTSGKERDRALARQREGLAKAAGAAPLPGVDDSEASHEDAVAPEQAITDTEITQERRAPRAAL